MLAIKRLEKIEIPETVNASGKPTPLARDAKLLVRLFKNYRDFVVTGAWYPDHVLADNAGDYSHSLKHTTFLAGEKPQFFKMPDTMEVYQYMKSHSPIYKNKVPYLVVKGNLHDRCDAMAHTIVDNFKIQYHEEKGNPILPSSTHMALRFFMLSHYLADAHMPLHCDARPLGKIHASIEGEWETFNQGCRGKSHHPAIQLQLGKRRRHQGICSSHRTILVYAGSRNVSRVTWGLHTDAIQEE